MVLVDHALTEAAANLIRPILHRNRPRITVDFQIFRCAANAVLSTADCVRAKDLQCDQAETAMCGPKFSKGMQSLQVATAMPLRGHQHFTARDRAT
jgi:hypothetical protein